MLTRGPRAIRRPFISVVTPSRNQGAFIERCIRSVVEQRYPAYEHIVVDNCSTDGTLDVLRRFGHLAWVSEPDRGQSHALNKALARARGDVVAWINADDYYEPGAFACAVASLAAHPSALAVAGAVRVIGPAGRPPRIVHARYAGPDGLVEFWNGGYGLCQPGVFFRRRAFEELGPFREDLSCAMDYDFWLRLASRGPIRTVARVLANYVIHPASKSGRARFGEGFNEELERVSRRYWGPAFSAQRRRRRRACNRFIAEQHLNAVLAAHKAGAPLPLDRLLRLLWRRPATALHPWLLAVAAERLFGHAGWQRIRRCIRPALGGRHAT